MLAQADKIAIERSRMEPESTMNSIPPLGAVSLSYAAQDAEAGRRICEALGAAGIEVWFDRSEDPRADPPVQAIHAYYLGGHVCPAGKRRTDSSSTSEDCSHPKVLARRTAPELQ
jgi:hypothetical protein